MTQPIKNYSKKIKNEYVRKMKKVSVVLANPSLFSKLLKIGWLSLFYKRPVQKEINGVIFEFDLDYDPAIKYMYLQRYERKVVEAIKKYLKKGGIFIDVGANIGYLSGIGAGIAGKTGEVHSFEPVPQHYNKLKRLSEINPEYKIIVNQCALGAQEGKGEIKITNLRNIGWNTMVKNFMVDSSKVKEILEVPVQRLDRYIEKKALNNISLFKIDVEGFEFDVLQGLKDYFENTNYYPPIICEVNPTAYSAIGRDITELIDYMNRYKYKAYNLGNNDIEIDIKKLKEITEVIFLSPLNNAKL